jgi:hypothetical protein
MRLMLRLTGLVLLGVIGLAVTADAQTAAETAVRWGLVGTWQTDCSVPPTEKSAAQVYLVQDGKLFLSRFDGKTSDSNPITSATINAKGEIELVVEFPEFSQKRLNVQAKDGQGRRRMMQNKNLDTGEFSVIDGKLTHNGAATPWATRCQ